MVFQILRRLLNGLLAVYWLISSSKVFAPYFKKNPENCKFVAKTCGDSMPSLAWNLFAGAYSSDNGIMFEHVVPSLGKLDEGDQFPRDVELVPLAPEQMASILKKQAKELPRVVLGDVVAHFGGVPVVLNIGSIT